MIVCSCNVLSDHDVRAAIAGEPLPRSPERKPGGGPIRRQLQTLLQELRRGGLVAFGGAVLGIEEAAIGPGIA